MVAFGESFSKDLAGVKDRSLFHMVNAADHPGEPERGSGPGRAPSDGAYAGDRAGAQ